MPLAHSPPRADEDKKPQLNLLSGSESDEDPEPSNSQSSSSNLITKAAQQLVRQEQTLNTIKDQLSHLAPVSAKMSNNFKLPMLWTKCPVAWFVQAEVHFETQKITDDREKFNLVVTALQQDTILKVLNLIQNPPTTDAYKALKAKIIDQYSLSEESRLEELLSKHEIGDRRPSEFYQHLVTMAGSNNIFSSDLLLKLWKRYLPSTINIALVASGKTDTEELITMADKMWNSSKSQNLSSILDTSISQPSTSVPQLANSNTALLGVEAIQSLVKAIGEMSCRFHDLESQINEIKSNYGQRNFNLNRSRSRSRQRFRSNSRFRSPTASGYCFYHQRFGPRARKCESPCNYAKKPNEDPKNY